MEECGELRDARCLLHGVGDDHDAIVFTQLADEFLDAGRGNRVQRRTRFVHQNDFRVDRDGACDAQPLLLAAGKAGTGRIEAVLYFFEETGALERIDNDFLKIRP